MMDNEFGPMLGDLADMGIVLHSHNDGTCSCHINLLSFKQMSPGLVIEMVKAPVI
jgi:hypothetical protein